MKKPTISIFTASQGHTSISSAIVSKSKLFNVYTNYHHDIEFTFYTHIYRLAPKQFKIIYNLGTHKSVQILSNFLIRILHSKNIHSDIDKQKPQLSISTYSLLNHTLNSILSSKHIPLINIIHNPHTIHPLEAYHYGPNLVFDQTAANRLVELNVPEHLIIKSGWFVRPQFEQPYNQNQVRKKLKLPLSQPIFLIQTGSEGTQTILPFLKHLQSKHLSQIIVACGNNHRLHTLVNNLRPPLKANNVHLTALPFTKDIHLYMQAADLVVGKAGPNTIFEATATHTPFFATNHIAGQEDGNLDLIKDYNLGYVEENPTKASSQINNLLNQPNQLKKFQPSLKKLAHYNRQSINILHQQIQQALTQKNLSEPI